MIYFISDTHAYHQNIAGENVSRWKEGYRNYGSTEKMNEAIVKAINKTVKEDDTLYHIGDWSFGGVENILNFRKQLRCENIHLILGNHDTHIENNKTIRLESGLIINSQDLFSSVSHYKEIEINGQRFVLFHYGLRSWHWAGKGTIHLYGHSHDMLPPYGKSMDVGIDVALRMFKEPRPFSITEILEFMKKQPNHTRNE